MIESDDYEPKPLTVERVHEAMGRAMEESKQPSNPRYPVMVPQEVYDRLVAAGAEKGFEPIPQGPKGPNLDLIAARSAILTGVPVRTDTAMRLGMLR